MFHVKFNQFLEGRKHSYIFLISSVASDFNSCERFACWAWSSSTIWIFSSPTSPWISSSVRRYFLMTFILMGRGISSLRSVSIITWRKFGPISLMLFIPKPPLYVICVFPFSDTFIPAEFINPSNFL